MKPNSQDQPIADLTGFGLSVYTLMLSRGYRAVTKLAAAMTEDEEDGFRITRQVISNYITGKRKVPAAFVVRLADVLNLNQGERAELAWAFAYGQGGVLDPQEDSRPASRDSRTKSDAPPSAPIPGSSFRVKGPTSGNPGLRLDHREG